jgi:hypothetical protein
MEGAPLITRMNIHECTKGVLKMNLILNEAIQNIIDSNLHKRVQIALQTYWLWKVLYTKQPTPNQKSCWIRGWVILLQSFLSYIRGASFRIKRVEWPVACAFMSPLVAVPSMWVGGNGGALSTKGWRECLTSYLVSLILAVPHWK